MSSKKEKEFDITNTINEAIHMIAAKYVKAEDCFSCDIKMSTEEIINNICKNYGLHPSDIQTKEVFALLKRCGFNNVLVPGKVEWTWPLNLR